MIPFWEVHDVWQLLGLVILLAFNAYQIRQNKAIVKSTNGLVDKRVEAAVKSAHSDGILLGAKIEQERIATSLAAANAVATRVEEIRSKTTPPDPPLPPT